MSSFENIDILKLIFTSTKPKHVYNLQFRVKNKHLIKQALGVLTFEKIFKSINQNTITLKGHKETLTALALLPNDKLVSASRDSFVKIWDLSSYKCIQTLKGHTEGVNALLVLQNGDIITGGEDWLINIWSSKRGNQTQYECVEILTDKGCVNCLLLLPNGKLAYGSSRLDRGKIKLWDLNTYKSVGELKVHNKPIYCMINISKYFFATGSADKNIKIWKIYNGYHCIKTLEGHEGAVLSLLYHNGYLISGSSDSTIKLWDYNRYYQCVTLNGHLHSVYCLVALPSGYFASSSFDDTIKFWNVETGKCIHSIDAHSDSVDCFVTLKDFRIVSGCYNGAIKIWDC
jgi:WD40 repeat protein